MRHERTRNRFKSIDWAGLTEVVGGNPCQEDAQALCPGVAPSGVGNCLGSEANHPKIKNPACKRIIVPNAVWKRMQGGRS